MVNSNNNDLTDYIRALQSRMLRHSIDHLPDTIDARTGAILVKNDMLKREIQSQLPEREILIVKDPHHKDRLNSREGPYILFRAGESNGLIELSKLFLDPELRIRQAALVELDRQISLHSQKNAIFLSPHVGQNINDRREQIVSENKNVSLTACIEVHDSLINDFFYQISGVKQCAEMQDKSELQEILNRLLKPNEEAISFLLQLPVWSPERQSVEIVSLQNNIIENAPSITEALEEYFRLFGHVPLRKEFSASNIILAWSEKHGLDENMWNAILDWANSNGSPYAKYHACQILCNHPNWIPEEHQSDFLKTIIQEIIIGVKKKRWQLRCGLARHYCRHLEMLGTGGDGERIAAFSWWLADYVGAIFDGFSDSNQQIVSSVASVVFKESAVIWNVARPSSSISSLRYATLFSESTWAISVLCELSQSSLLQLLENNNEETTALKNVLGKMAYCTVNRDKDMPVGYAFESSMTELVKHVIEVSKSDESESINIIRKTIQRVRAKKGLESQLGSMQRASLLVARIIAHEFRIEAMSGRPPCKVLFDLLSDENWRKEVLVDGDESTVELLLYATIEVALHDNEREWHTYLPHFFARSCEESEGSDRKKLLFSCTVASSLATHSVSAIERLLKSEGRREYQQFVEDWRDHIEYITPIAPAWIRAKLRGLKCVLYIG